MWAKDLSRTIDYLETRTDIDAARLAYYGVSWGGALGGVIGSSFVTLQCRGDCSVPSGIGMLVGTIVTALGVAVVAALTLRACATSRRRVRRSRCAGRGTSSARRSSA